MAIVKVAINGFGRIGRNILRAIYETGRRTNIMVVAINELAELKVMAYLLKYDSSHGHFNFKIREKRDILQINNDNIKVLHQNCLKNLPWRELNVDVVLDCTGIYGTYEDGKAHIIAGAKKVLFSHSGSNDLDATVIFGVNEKNLKKTDCIVSNASCTSNCAIPVIKLIDDAFNIKSGMITIIHSAMNDQRVIDGYNNNCNDKRRTRAASQSIVPVDTGLLSGITRIFPKFNNCFDVIALRVPTINVTAIDLNIVVRQTVKTTHEINSLLQNAAYGKLNGIIDYIELPLVSIDFNHNPHSAIVDGTQTKVCCLNLIKILLWCDNEWGFANRMLDTTLAMVANFEYSKSICNNTGSK